MRVSMQIVAVALALSTLSLPARSDTATHGTTQQRMVIYFGDLQLNTAHDAKIMVKRINTGATKACGGEHAFSSYTGGPDDRYKECRETTIRRALEQLNVPLVTRLYSETKSSRSNTALSLVAGTRN